MNRLRAKASTLILLALVLGLAIYWWPQDIDRGYTGYVTSHDGVVEESVDIRVVGRLHRRLLTRFRFEGELIVDGVALPARFGVPGNFRMVILEFRERWTSNTLSSDILQLDEENYLHLRGRLMLTPDLRQVGGFVQGVTELNGGRNVNFAAPAANTNDVSRVIWELSQGTPFAGD